MADFARSPNLFIVGAPKCATTAMANYLGQHPEIYMAKQKELHYFGEDLISKNRLGGTYSLERYLSFFAEAGGEKYVGEASVLYLCSKSAPYEIKKFSPEAKIIIMLRNPVEVMYALHSQLLAQADEDIASFEAALDAEPFRRMGRMVPKGVKYIDDGLLYREVVGFSSQVARYFRVFGRENVYISLYDDVKANVHKEYRSILLYLGLEDTEFYPKFEIVNANKQVKYLLLQQFARNPPRMLVCFLKAWLPKKFAILLRNAILARNIRNVARANMDVRLRSRLADEFGEEISKLGSLIGKDLSSWLRAP